MITDYSKMDVVHNYSVMTLALGIGYAAYYWLYIAKVRYSKQKSTSCLKTCLLPSAETE